MAKKKSPFTGDMSDWTAVTSKPRSKIDSADRPLSKPDRVAREQQVVVDKYLSDQPAARTAKRFGNPHAGSRTDHAELVRAKKKGAPSTTTPTPRPSSSHAATRSSARKADAEPPRQTDYCAA
jgi:hypothetical protein